MTVNRMTIIPMLIYLCISKFIGTCIFYFAASAENDKSHKYCQSHYVHGELLLKDSGRFLLDNGAFYEQVVDGPYRYLKLKFNHTVDLLALNVQTRINPTLSILLFDEFGKSEHQIEKIRSAKNISVETIVENEPPITEIIFQGFDAQLTYDEIILINVTVCAHNCRYIKYCIDGCKNIFKDFGCPDCDCENSTLDACLGYPTIDEVELKKTKLEEPQCRITEGYRRFVDIKNSIDDCLPFRYSNCNVVKPKKYVLKSRVECLKNCY